MPWEIIATEASKIAAKEGSKYLMKVFQDHIRPWVSSKIKGTHAEKYLSLSSNELLLHYYKETPCAYRLGNNTYCLPMCKVICGNEINNS